MLYKAAFEKFPTKGNPISWDEDTYDFCIFTASDDETARHFVATSIEIMHKIDETKRVAVTAISRIIERGNFLIEYREVSIENCVPFSNADLKRKTFEAFYPEKENVRYFPILNIGPNLTKERKLRLLF
ncbi:MAG: hypothetical protein HGA61_03250 [Candidatus Moranbacteria bacterium]|nr:hypothetical protein [Candidatus Moranbacteria bacterium]